VIPKYVREVLEVIADLSNPPYNPDRRDRIILGEYLRNETAKENAHRAGHYHAPGMQECTRWHACAASDKPSEGPCNGTPRSPGVPPRSYREG